MSTLSTPKNTVNKMEDAVEHTSRAVREVANDAGNTVREFIHNKSEQAAEIRQKTEERIVQHPMQSVALAALGGLVLGALLRR